MKLERAMYKTNIYEFNGIKPVILIPKEARDYIRVGITYYKIYNGELIKWNEKTIKTDFRGLSKNILSKMEKFNRFCNHPDNSENYMRRIGEDYNLYQPVKFKPEEGSYKKIEKYLKHLTNQSEDNIKDYNILLDYLTLLYNQPKQMLPILCLLSEKRNTGKTTFLNLLRQIFDKNFTKINLNQLGSAFNDHFITKLIIGIDEADTSTTKFFNPNNTLKELSTSTNQKLYKKHADPCDIEFYGKFVINSNNIFSFLEIDPEEKRYFILEVPELKKDDLDPDLLEKMEKEILAFLYFLKNRKMVYPKKSRMWFDEELFNNEHLNSIKEYSRTDLAKNVSILIKDVFEVHEDKDELRLVLDNMHEILDIGYLERKTSRNKLKDCFHIELKIKTAKSPSNKVDLLSHDLTFKPTVDRKNYKYYLFRREDFISDAT